MSRIFPVNFLNETKNRIEKRLFLWQFFVLCALCGAAVFFLVSLSASQKSSASYMRLRISELSRYDPYLFDKVFLPVTEKRGMLVALDERTHAVFWEGVLGGEYEIVFLNEGKAVGRSAAKPENFRMVLPVPVAAGEAGYDSLLFLPKAGRSFFLSYLAPLTAPEEAKVTRPAPPLRHEAYFLGGKYKEAGVPEMIQGLFAFFEEGGDGALRILVKSITSLRDIELLRLENGKGETVARFPPNTSLKAYREGDEGRTFELPLSRVFERHDLFIRYRYGGGGEVKRAPVNPFAPQNERLYNETLIRTKDTLADFPSARDLDGAVFFDGTDVVIDKPLFIPKGKVVFLHAGQRIDLRNGAFIVSRSPVFASGTSERPVVLTSSDDSPNAGLVVLQADGRSVIEHMVFDNLGEVCSGAWQLTGAVTFYESDVDFIECRFLNNRSEDGLNTIRSDFKLIGCVFKNTASDAFDADFCTGVIDECRFETTGNDAVDVSTSTITLKNSTFFNIHDKALSVGERSTATIEGVFAENVQIALGAKDDSSIVASDVSVRNALIAVSSYQKKPEFGPSRIRVDGLALNGSIEFAYIIQKHDELHIDGRRMQPSNKKKEALIIKKLINEEPIR